MPKFKLVSQMPRASTLSVFMRVVYHLLLLIVATAAYGLNFDDWYSSGCEQSDRAILCNGCYKEPKFQSNIADDKQPLTITANSAQFIAKSTSEFTGNVIAEQSNKLIYADKAKAYQSSAGELTKIDLSGNVKIMQPGLRVDGTRAIYQIAQDRKTISNGQYRVYAKHARGNADTIELNGRSQMQVQNCSYTTCAPGDNAWSLRATSTNFDRDTGRGEARNARLYVQQVPVFYWPYLNFPIDKRRQTGFLQPSFESSTRNGRTVIVPFYWNIAPNYDLTVTSSYMSKRSAKFDNSFRYLTHKSNGRVEFDFLPYDRAYKSLRLNKHNDPSFMNASNIDDILRRRDLTDRNFRYKIYWKNNTELSRYLNLSIDYLDASDGNYLYDFDEDNSDNHKEYYSTVYALQRANLSQATQFGSFNYRVERYKNFYVVDGPAGAMQLAKLPEIAFSSRTWQLPAKLNVATTANFASFRPRFIEGGTLNYGQRKQLRPSLSMPISTPAFFITPRVQLNYLKYSGVNHGPTNNASPSKTIPMYDVKTGLVFERDLKFNNQKFLQTLEPQLYYLYVPEVAQNDLPNFDSGRTNFDYYQVFRDNRYTGLDRVAEANQLGIGLASRFYNQADGSERGMLAIGRIRYFRNVILRLNEPNNIAHQWSPLAMLARLNLNSKYSLEANVVRQKHYTNTISLQAQYRHDDTKILNFGYEYIRDPAPDLLTRTEDSDVKQLNVSAVWKLKPSFRLLGKFSYDLRFSRDLETLAGFEYHSCCTAIRFIWSRNWLPNTFNVREHSNRFRIQFIFKGLGGVGQANDQYIADKIPGYSPSSRY